MTYKSNVTKIFDQLFESLPEIPYDPKWANKTGYFDGAYSMPVQGKCKDPAGRRMILVQLPDGDGSITTAVWNERYSNRSLPLVLGGGPRFLGTIEVYSVDDLEKSTFTAGKEAAARVLRNLALREQPVDADIVLVMVAYARSVRLDDETTIILSGEWHKHIKQWCQPTQK